MIRLFGVDISVWVGPNLNKDIPQQTSTSHINNVDSLNSCNDTVITTNDSLNSNNGTLITINRQENQERVLKRSCSSEESQTDESSKKPKKHIKPRPSKEEKQKAEFKPPNLPSELLEKIKGMNGDEPKLVMQKYIFSSDVLPRQNRLLIPKKEILKYGQELALKEEEKRVLEEGDDIDVVVILRNNEMMNLKLSKWPKHPNNLNKSGNYLIQGGWMEVKNKIDLKEGDVAQLWSFRFGQEQRLAFVFLQVVNEAISD